MVTPNLHRQGGNVCFENRIPSLMFAQQGEARHVPFSLDRYNVLSNILELERFQTSVQQ